MFFLPHSPRPINELDGTKIPIQEYIGGRAPWFLLMRSTGMERGGDHYEPMICTRLKGKAFEEFGTIGD